MQYLNAMSYNAFMASMILETLAVGPFQSNVFILGNEETREAIVIDPGDDIPTHGHIDHVSGVKELKDATGAAVFLHKGGIFLYERLPTQASFFGIAVNDN